MCIIWLTMPVLRSWLSPACRKGKGSVFKSHTKLNKNPVKFRKLDYAEKTGYVKASVDMAIWQSVE